MSKDPNLDDLSFDAVIPSALLLNENLEPNAIKLYAFIRGLTKAHGYCYATNGYLSKCMKCDESTVKRLLLSLKSEGFIEIHTNKEGIHWQRHIYMGVNFNKCLRRLKNKPPPAQNRATIEDIKSKIFEEGERESAAPPPPPPLPKPKEKEEKASWEFRHGRVRMKEKEFGALIKEFGEERVKIYLDKLDRYGNTNPKRFRQYESHAEKIKEWIIADSQETSSAKTDTAAGRAAARAESEADNRYLADRIAKDASRTGMSNVIYAGASYIQFTYSDNLFVVRYHDPDFRKKVTQHLKKLKIPTNGL